MDDNLIAPPEGKAVVYIVRPSNQLEKYESYIFCDGSFIDKKN